MARRLAAIMAGDVVGYSRLMADDEAGTYGSLRAGVDEVVVPSVTTRGGRVFKTTGDGFLAVFDSAGAALDAAVAIQDGFAGRPLQLRIGLNLGDVIQDQGDVFGDGVNVAARLEAMAEPGGICASVAVVRAIGRRSDLHFTPLAGHIPSRAVIKYLVEQKDMEVWLAPVTGTRIVVPFRILVPTPVGDAVVEATQFVVTPVTKATNAAKAMSDVRP